MIILQKDIETGVWIILSTDQSGQLSDDYAEQDCHIRVIHQKNHGQASARNTGIGLSLIKWIAFVDADDMIHPQYFEILYRRAVENKVKISACHAVEGKNLPENFLMINRCVRYDILLMKKIFENSIWVQMSGSVSLHIG